MVFSALEGLWFRGSTRTRACPKPFNCVRPEGRMQLNGLQLAEGGDFQHNLPYEALKFIHPQNCPTKHETATLGKLLLSTLHLVRFKNYIQISMNQA